MLNPLEGTDEWEVRPPKKRSPWLYLIVAGALGYGAYHSAGFQAKLNAVFDKSFSKDARAYLLRATSQAKLLAKMKEPEPAAKEENVEGGSVSVSVTAAPPAPKPVPATVWTIRVNAYDLLELKPVKGLSVKLRAPIDGKVFQAKAKRGVFEFHVPRVTEGGYHLDVRLAGRPVHYIEDSADVPYREHDETRRLQEADELRAEKVLHVALRAEDVSGKLEYPIVVLP